MSDGRHTELLSELSRLASRLAGDVGLELVELTLRGSSRRRVLRVDVDRAGPTGVGLEDCAKLSRAGPFDFRCAT